MTKDAKNLFDFTDLSDLPEELAGRMAGSTAVNPNVAIYAGIVQAGAQAGATPLSISQIEAVARRMGIEVKSQQSIRGALNAAVAAGTLMKPTRQTYDVTIERPA